MLANTKGFAEISKNSTNENYRELASELINVFNVE